MSSPANTAALVTVVMPSFNQGRFIEAAARSVLEQDYPALELLIVDGGSTDGTLPCLERLLGVFGNKLRWLSENDSGPANAINKALQLARGEFVGWLNSDDLYAPGAVATAAAYLTAHPQTVMVYGEAEHVDETGMRLAAYPTRRPPVAPETFQEGCFICQPSVFLRREVFDTVGLLDESLATAFDFELWIRLFHAFPERIAFIDHLLARSRLHADCITSSQRRLVAIENIRILGKHFDYAKPHWMLTYVEELYASYPHGSDSSALQANVQAALNEVESSLQERDFIQLKDLIARDARFQLALPGLFAGVYSDGWTPPQLLIRVRGTGAKRVLLHCDHCRPDHRPLRLAVRASWGDAFSLTVDKIGRFELAIPVPENYVETNYAIIVDSLDAFVPEHSDAESADERALVCKLLRVELSSAS
ncbi:MAG: glycosyltransferase [Candidatus Accumulibacter sp.]|nr:glycosyltransferase [Accumulibacter sp.]